MSQVDSHFTDLFLLGKSTWNIADNI